MTEGNYFDGWRFLSMPEVCDINPTRPRNLTYSDETLTSFVPMAAVDDQQGQIVDLQTRPFVEIKRGYTYFEENDVLFAKITPCMENGKSAIARGLINGFGFGSTEFHVLRPHHSILPEWIYYFVRREPFRQEAKTNFRGAVGQQRVPQEFLQNYSIPIPYPDDPERSLAVQSRVISRIENIYHELAEARRLHEKIVADTNRLMDAVLAEIFPNPENILKEGWILRSVEELSNDPQYGYTASANKQSDGVKFLRITDIQNGTVDWLKVPSCDCTKREVDQYGLRDGDIVFARTGATTGKTFLVRQPPEAIFASYLIRLQITRFASPDFVYWYFQSPYYWQQIIPRGGAQPNMNAQLLKKVRIPVPESFALQDQIVEQILSVKNEIDGMQEQSRETGALLAYLESSILAHAFRGEL